MPLYDLYSKRKKAAGRAGQSDVYVYDILPDFFRKQVGIVIRDTFGRYVLDYEGNAYQFAASAETNRLWEFVSAVMRKECAAFENFSGNGPAEKITSFLRNQSEVDDVLDLIELCCRIFDSISENDLQLYEATQSAADAIKEINGRFREHGVGYQYENSQLVRVDSQYIHGEVVKPAFTLLADKLFKKANDDFMTAHRHYRHGEYKDVTTAAQRAFESTLKAICHDRGWAIPEGARASELITTCRRNGLFRDYLDKGFDSYIAMLKTGLPNVRNNAGGHGEAPDAPSVPEHIAAYAIHMTATNIVLAVTAFKALG